MSISREIQHILLEALRSLQIEGATVVVEQCSSPDFGDYTSNVAMQCFPSVDHSRWNSPRSLAQAIADHCSANEHSERFIASTSVAGPGFINFTVNDEYFTTVLNAIFSQEMSFHTINDGKKAVVEYSSPNIAKPFTVGHLRSTIIGDTIANLLAATGYTVYRDNHLGDWGTQFGKLIVAIEKLGAGNEEANIAAISASEKPVKELVALYIEFHDKAEHETSLEDEARSWFTKLESGDPKARELWQRCIDWSWQEFSAIYTQLGVSFTENNGRGYGESYFEDKMKPVVAELDASGHLQEGKEGARLFFFPEDVLPPLMILKKDGSTLYATRDLATDKFRLEKYGKDILVVNEVGAEQSLYFEQIFKIEELLGWYNKGQRVHVKHGLFRFKEGKMSTRKGNVIWLEDVIREAQNRALKLSKSKNEESSNQVAIGALKWNDLKRSSHLDVTFDWDEILSMEGNSSPYIQYTAVRAQSVLKKNVDEVSEIGTTMPQLNAQERALATSLMYFEETIERAAATYSPQLLCTYLYGLANAFNSFYTTNRILDDEANKNQRILLTKATLMVLSEGLKILGISIPAEM